jgi:Na+/proline symporter
MGGEMREIVDAGEIGSLFTILAIVLPPICLLIGWWNGSRRKDARRGAILGLLVGLLGPLNLLMWRIYNAITDTIGLDTVRNLVINLILFLVSGGVIGVVAGIAIRRINGVQPASNPPEDAE